MSKLVYVFILLWLPLYGFHFTEVANTKVDHARMSGHYWIEITNFSGGSLPTTDIAISNNYYNLQKFLLPNLTLEYEDSIVLHFSGASSTADFTQFHLTISDQGIGDNSPTKQVLIPEFKSEQFIDSNENDIWLNFERDDSVKFNSSVNLPSDFTVSYWIKPTRSGGFCVLLNSQTYYRSLGHNNLNQVSLWVSNIRIDLSEPLKLNEWQAVTLTRHDNNVTVFLNGQAVGNATWSGRLEFDQIGGTIANLHWAGYEGGVKDVVIFDYALSNFEVVDLVNGNYMPGIHIPFTLSSDHENQLFISHNGQILDSLYLWLDDVEFTEGYPNSDPNQEWQLLPFSTPGSTNPPVSEWPHLNYSISEWLNNKKASVSVHFDDNTVTHFTVAQQIMDDLSIPGTFHIIAGWLNSNLISLAQNAVSMGHEIGSHAMTHPRLADIDHELMVWEIQESKRVIEDLFMGPDGCVVIAYPSGSFNQSVIETAIEAGYIMGRKVGWPKRSIKIQDSFTEDSFFSLGSTYTVTSNSSAESFSVGLLEAIDRGEWYNPMFHGIEGRGWSPITGETFSEMMELIDANRESLWIATVGDITRYSRQRLAAELVINSINNDVYELILDDGLDNNVYYLPLTLNIANPLGKIAKEVWDSDNNSIAFSATHDRIVLNKYPDGQPFFVRFEDAQLSSFTNWMNRNYYHLPIAQRTTFALVDGSSLPNLIRFFSGVRDNPIALKTNSNGQFYIEWTQHLRANRQDYSIQQSTDLVNWSNMDSTNVEFMGELNNLNHWRLEIDKTPPASRFFRIIINE